MVIELIPVIDISYTNNDIPLPGKSPYWEHPELWNKYHDECYLKAGFKDTFKPYLSGSSFYHFPALTDRNLAKIIDDHTAEMRNGVYGRNDLSALSGGYVLNVNGDNVYFPQCCGNLSNIEYWEDLTTSEKTIFYPGHPAPAVSKLNNTIVLNFVQTEFSGEPFTPQLPYSQIELDKATLSIAIQKVKKELDNFIARVESISAVQDLHIESVGQLLVSGGFVE